MLWNLSGHLLPSKETEDEMIGWHHQLNRHEFEQVLERVKDREAWHTAVHGLAESGTIARACVQPLVGELRSHNPQGTAKKKKWIHRSAGGDGAATGHALEVQFRVTVQKELRL